MKDTTAIRKVAPRAENEDREAQEVARLEAAIHTANALIKQIGASALLIDSCTSEKTGVRGNVYSIVLDAVYELCHRELPSITEGPVSTLEGAAAFGAAIFGSELVPDPHDQEAGSRCSLAFRVARVMLEAEANCPSEAFFIACALAMRRMSEKRHAKEAERVVKRYQKQQEIAFKAGVKVAEAGREK